MKEWVAKFNEERKKRIGMTDCEILLASIWGAYEILLDVWSRVTLNFYQKGPRGITIEEHRGKDNRIMCKGTVKRYIKAWGVLVKGDPVSAMLDVLPERESVPTFALPERPIPEKLPVPEIERGLHRDLNTRTRRVKLLERLHRDVALERRGLWITDYEVIDVYLTDLTEDKSEATLNVYLRVTAKKQPGGWFREE